MTRLRLALAQYPIERLRSLEDFEVKLNDILGAAKEDGADLLVLPEYAAMELAAAFTDAGDAVSERDAVVARADQILAVMQEGARRHGIWLLGGSVPMLRAGAVRNRAPLISADGKIVFQEKRVMTRFETESWNVSAGEEPQVFDTPWGRIGIAHLLRRGIPHAGARPGRGRRVADPGALLHRYALGFQSRASLGAGAGDRESVLRRHHADRGRSAMVGDARPQPRLCRHLRPL